MAFCRSLAHPMIAWVDVVFDPGSDGWKNFRKRNERRTFSGRPA